MDKPFKQIESRILRHVRSLRDSDDLNAVILAVKTARAMADRELNEAAELMYMANREPTNTSEVKNEKKNT